MFCIARGKGTQVVDANIGMKFERDHFRHQIDFATWVPLPRRATHGSPGMTVGLTLGLMMNPKVDVREAARTNRAALAHDCPDFAQRIARFAGDLAIAKNAVVSFYWPMGDEADPRELANALAACGHMLALPVVVAKRSPLQFRSWREGDVLIVHPFGMHEPAESAARVTPDVLLVPLLAFDAKGTRLGYGGGFYDRTLHSLRTKRAIGIAYAGQELEALPCHGHDHSLDAVVTQKGVRVFT
jgi:5-formyltetrahydrofolate cyclo-ligase